MRLSRKLLQKFYLKVKGGFIPFQNDFARLLSSFHPTMGFGGLFQGKRGGR